MGENTGKKRQRRPRHILIVSDDIEQIKQMKAVLEENKYKVSTSGGIKDANSLVALYLGENSQPFDLAIVKLRMAESDSPVLGADFAKRLYEILGINVVVMTKDLIAARLLSFRVRALGEPFNDTTLLKTTKEMLGSNKRRNVGSNDIVLNRWINTAGLSGVDSLELLSCDMDAKVVKITAVTIDGHYVNFVVYTKFGTKNKVKVIGLACSIGCASGGCGFCNNWKDLVDETGKAVKFKRVLTAREIIAQIFLAMNRPQLQKLFSDKSDTALAINFTCSGDWAFYPDNICEAIMLTWKSIAKPSINEIIITTIGTEISLMDYRLRFMERFIDIGIPISFYFSLISADQKIRERVVPGAKGQSLEKMRDSLEVIARKTGRQVTITIIVIHKLTDRLKDVELLKQYFGGRFMPGPDGKPIPVFRIKVQGLVPGSMKGYSASRKHVRIFCKRLIKAGLDVRVRNIEGVSPEVQGGCGITIEKGRSKSKQYTGRNLTKRG